MTEHNEIQLLAHRGYAARYPENTREALGAAVNAGARAIEFDVQLSADGVPFLLHDESFQRTAGVEALIGELTAEQVASIDVHEPDRFGDTYTGIRAPELQAIADDLAGWANVTGFVELKRQSIERFGIDAFLDAVLPVLLPVLERCVVISFSADIVAAARERSGCRIGWALRAWDAAHEQQAADLQPDYLFCNVTRLPAAPVPLWTGAWRWVAYEVIDAELARQLTTRGVGMIETMAYPELAAALAALNAA
jgi:glycerophosphoryl diester phosphodiesterase